MDVDRSTGRFSPYIVVEANHFWSFLTGFAGYYMKKEHFSVFLQSGFQVIKTLNSTESCRSVLGNLNYVHI